MFSVSVNEADGLNKPGSVVAELEDRVIRLRGLPFSATKEDIESFLTGMFLSRIILVQCNFLGLFILFFANHLLGTGLMCDEVVIGQTGGRPSGEAYVRLATKEQAAQALELNRKMMGSRWGIIS